MEMLNATERFLLLTFTKRSGHTIPLRAPWRNTKFGQEAEEQKESIAFVVFSGGKAKQSRRNC